MSYQDRSAKSRLASAVKPSQAGISLHHGASETAPSYAAMDALRAQLEAERAEKFRLETQLARTAAKLSRTSARLAQARALLDRHGVDAPAP